MQTHKVRYNSSLHVILIPCDGADTSGEQLRELQRLLIRMMKGEVNAVQPKVKSSTGLVGSAEATCEEWAASLPFSFIWLGMYANSRARIPLISYS